MRKNYTQKDVDRFWGKINKDGNCWTWKDHTNQDGYGRISWRGKKESAHRVSWELTYGEIPNNLCVLHKCDNRLCCNPSHLWLGTAKDNADDRETKGRGGHIGGVGKKLTREQVEEIRAKYAAGGISQSALAREYKISQTHIFWIIHRLTWK